MKKNIQYMILVILAAMLVSSCKKYLEVNAQSDYVYISKPSDLQLLLDGYILMNTNYPAEQLVSADEYYVTDASLSALSSQPVENMLYIWDKDAIRPINAGNTDWQYAYQRISTVNLVLENVEKLRKGSNADPSLDGIQGAALFYRAYSFWAITQLYAKGYNQSTAQQDAGVALRLTSSINEKLSRSSVQQTYDQVLNDLKKATALLPDVASTSSRPSKAAAYAMLARVYLSMSDYSSALENASASLAINNKLLNYNQISITSATPFTIFNNEDLFHVVSRSSSSILTPGGGTGGYAKIDPLLYNSYDAKDLRKQIFFKANTGTDAGTYRFSGNYDQTTGTSFFTGLAVDEVYLTRAECYARLGQLSPSLADLNMLLQNRYVNTVTSPYIPVTAGSADAALTRILAERKKELVMRGLRWTDLKRLNMDPATAVTLSRTANGTTYTLPPNDLRYVLLIPSLVTSSGNIPQNPR